MTQDNLLCDPALRKRMEEAVAKLSKAHSAALDGWLERCVERWCPKAWALGRAGMYREAHDELVKEGFRWTEERMDGTRELVATFWQDDVPLMRMRIGIQFTAVSLDAESKTFKAGPY